MATDKTTTRTQTENSLIQPPVTPPKPKKAKKKTRNTKGKPR
jgi:hypothetical protein